MNSLTVRSFAKINLGLLVKEKCPDGYHNIETIFVPIRLSDKIRLKKINKNIIINIPNQKIKIPKGKTNLAYKAAELFFKESGIPNGIEITIEKNIPVGAGLGGGSSNAAAVLHSLNVLYGKPLSKEELYKLALKIGMDVPFFLMHTRPIIPSGQGRGKNLSASALAQAGMRLGKACYATGRGDILKPIKIPNLRIVLYLPNYPILTKWAYQKVQSSGGLTNDDLSLKILRKKLVKGDLRNLQRHILNSFEDLVFAHYPDLARIKEFFLTHGAYAASLSGSGSAVFGLVEKKNIYALRAALKRNKIKAVFAESISR
jgi:4-diphosphocytidyl-2-C-methyl-D-erythritol kinase